MVVDEKSHTAIIHIRSNNITKPKYHTINIDDLAKGIVNIGLKYKYYGVGQTLVSSVLARSNNGLSKVIKQVWELFLFLIRNVRGQH